MITEYTVLEFKGLHLDKKTPYQYWAIKLGDDLFFGGYDENKIKLVPEKGFYSHIAKKEYAYEYIDFLKKFFDSEGKRKI